jgi:hypothetical protein
MINLSERFAATGTSELQNDLGNRETWTHSAEILGTGAVSATVVVDATADPAGLTGWYEVCTLSPSGTTSAVDVLTGINVPVRLRYRCTAISADTVCIVRSAGAR